jgi:hypothetical protein
MKKWSIVNIQLLSQDHCHNIMQRAIILLDGLYTYWKNILDPIDWPSQIENNPILFLTKIYFNEDFNPDINELINYFELSSSEILLTITKIITKNNNNTSNIQLLNSIDLKIIDELSEIQTHLITETLKSFDEIMKASTISLWDFSRTKIPLSEASQILKAKMELEKITSATVAITQAINTALANITNNNTQEQATQLRISNLEKHIIQQVQTNKEILNHLKKHQDPQKEHRHTSKRSFTEEIVDLTDNGSNSPNITTAINNKRCNKQNIQWDSTIRHVQQYNPDATPKQLYASSNTLSNTKPFLGQSMPMPGPPSPFIGHTTLSLGQTTPFLGHTTTFLGQTPTNIYPPLVSQLTPGNPNTQNSHNHTSTSPGYFQQLISHNSLTQTPPNPFSHKQPQTPKRHHEGMYMYVYNWNLF